MVAKFWWKNCDSKIVLPKLWWWSCNDEVITVENTVATQRSGWRTKTVGPPRWSGLTAFEGSRTIQRSGRMGVRGKVEPWLNQSVLLFIPCCLILIHCDPWAEVCLKYWYWKNVVKWARVLGTHNGLHPDSDSNSRWNTVCNPYEIIKVVAVKSNNWQLYIVQEHSSESGFLAN